MSREEKQARYEELVALTTQWDEEPGPYTPEQEALVNAQIDLFYELDGEPRVETDAVVEITQYCVNG